MNDIIKELSDVVDKFEDVDYESEAGWDKVSDIEDQIKALLCLVKGEHSFSYDQCGWWQHKFCYRCGVAQYPDLARKSCSDLNAEMGEMTEEEYLDEQKKQN